MHSWHQSLLGRSRHNHLDKTLVVVNELRVHDPALINTVIIHHLYIMHGTGHVIKLCSFTIIMLNHHEYHTAVLSVHGNRPTLRKAEEELDGQYF